jgi:hypothetical protein
VSETTSELVERRRDLVAQRRELKAGLTRLAQDITALDRVLKMLDPSYVPEAPRANRPRGGLVASMFRWGETTSAALGSLRELGKANSSDVATYMLKLKGLAVDEPVRAELTAKVTGLFNSKVASGQVRRAGLDEGKQVLWEIAR